MSKKVGNADRRNENLDGPIRPDPLTWILVFIAMITVLTIIVKFG